MKDNKVKNAYKIVMLVILTVVITALITTLALYKELENKSVKYVIKSEGTSSSSGIGTTFATLQSFIEEKYIGELDENKMIEEAIKGYVSGIGDEYSEYITAEEMQSYMQETMGNYVGIGVYIAATTDNQILIVSPIKGSPAEAAGLQSGDILKKIDGVEYTGEQLSTATSILKQQEGTKVTLEILRGEETLQIEVERANVKLYHVNSEILEDNIGYIEIEAFADGTADEFKEAYEALEKQGIKSLIIDLRNNGGGIVEEATNIADMMIEKDKTIVITKSKSSDEVEKKATEDRTITIPVTILVNEYTASASEILAGALKDNDNAKIVGTKTYGKGVIQTIYQLSDGSGLKLTTAEYYTPNHTKINEEGITPDEIVENTQSEDTSSADNTEDKQLQKAIEISKDSVN